MPKRLPIKAAKDVAQSYGLRQVILLAWDGKITHCVTYGKTLEDCDQAAQGGNRLKKSMGVARRSLPNGTTSCTQTENKA